MSLFGSMKINTKFNLVMSFLLIFLFLTAALLTHQRQRSLILKVAVDNARSIAKQIIETRDYLSNVEKDEAAANYNLVPQVVATQIAKRMTKDTMYYVRQVSLRYRNPDNRPDEYETEQLQRFSGKAVKENFGIVNAGGKRFFRYMQPMVAEKSCLACHGSYEAAPQFIRQRFPRGHYSYNYKLGEVIGAVSVSVPMSELYREIGRNLKVDLMYRGVIFFIIIAIMAAVIRRIIIRPIRMLSESISTVTRTDRLAPRLPQRSDDEIGQLINAYNEMMEELARKTTQSQESEQRYRKFIEIARSAVVTFMQDGKIVITNQKAEELLGLSRQDLLGENFFGFFENSDELHEQVLNFLHADRTREHTLGNLHTVKNFSGVGRKVEIALSATEADGQQMITAIIRDLS